MKSRSLRVGSLCTLVLLFGFPSFAFRAPDRAQLPNIDNRPKAGLAHPTPGPAQATAAQKLRSSLPDARVDFDPVTGGPKFITGGHAFLTGPNGTSKAASASASSVFAADPHGPTKAFLQAHRELFGFGPETLEKAEIKRDSTAPHNGVKTVVWQQHVNGIPVFEATLVTHTTKRGELVSISSGFIPDPDAAANRSKVNVSAPGVPPAQAVALAARNVGEETKTEQVQPEAAAADPGPAKRQHFRAPGLNGSAESSLVWVPLDQDTVRLAWEVVLTSHSRGEMFHVLVDAGTGKILIRHGLTEYLVDATYRVYTSDSPSPFSPGWSTPNNTQPSVIPRDLVTTSALNTNASPKGWIPDSGNETTGNNVDAHTDVNGDDEPDLPRPQGVPARTFDFPMDLAISDPSAYRPASVVQLFYWNNWMHDKLYELGFTEVAGNFQNDNFGRGGLGNDAVQADAQDGSGTDNANFSTPLDGSAPRMQMFVFAKPVPKRDGDLDAEIVLHEYTHGLSNRQVNGGTGLTSLQSRGMGEGWSDFYALSLLSNAADDLNGCYAAGAYASRMLGGTGDTLNYYFGIRRYPYSTDLTKNPLTFKDIDPAQADYCNSGAPYHSGMFGNCTASIADEVHNQGEVWCVTLWEARARLIAKYGWATGNQLALQVVTDGMLYSPANPNFLQARDGILQADLVDNGGANLGELWAAFAKRGLGFSASSPSSSTVAGVHEAFDLPDDLRVLPAAGFIASGPAGGPFNVTSQSFTLTNFGTNSFTWILTNTAAWLTVSPSGGTLATAGPSTTVTASLNTTADTLPAGLYYGSILITNLISGVGQRRDFLLRIGQPDYFTELFEANDNDLAYSSLTFTPNGSASFYTVCREPATAFPTDPAGGNPVSLTDDSFAQVTISGSTLSIYGQTTDTFFIGSNGYLTTKSGDNAWTETPPAHFNRPRISALFHDQLPVNGTSISWKQTADLVAVTYQGLADIMETGLNDFQIEWFYDGRIRITYLRISNRQNLVGLSAGNGVPAGFVEMDLSAEGPCSPLQLTVPATATEGDGVLVNAGQVTLPLPLTTNLTVRLSSSDTSEVVVPATVDIPAGQTTANFDINIVDDNILDGSQLATVTADAPGFGSASQAIRVFDNETATLTIVAPATLVEGQGAAEGLLTLSTPSPANVLVSLSSSDTNKLLVPPTVLLAAGQTSTVFSITVVDNGLVNPTQNVTITAHVQNWTDGSAIIDVLDNPLPVTVARNPALITIVDNAPASPYPSIINVTGAVGVVSKVTVTISNIVHSFPDDIGIMLVSPSGTNLVLLANAGGGTDINGVTLTFDDAATARIPDSSAMQSGTFLPTSIAPGPFPAPAPSVSPASSLSVFNGTNPNGIWRLYVCDDSSVDSGRISNGWSLKIQTDNPIPPRPLILSCQIRNGSLQLSFSTVPAHTYFVEYSTGPVSADWLPLQTVAGDGTVKAVTDPSVVLQRFYRIRAQ